MFSAVPPWIAPMLTTPNSVGSFSRLITLCTSTMKLSVCCLLVLGVGESRFEHFANRLPRAAVELN